MGQFGHRCLVSTVRLHHRRHRGETTGRGGRTDLIESALVEGVRAVLPSSGSYHIFRHTGAAVLGKREMEESVLCTIRYEKRWAVWSSVVPPIQQATRGWLFIDDYARKFGRPLMLDKVHSKLPSSHCTVPHHEVGLRKGSPDSVNYNKSTNNCHRTTTKNQPLWTLPERTPFPERTRRTYVGFRYSTPHIFRPCRTDEGYSLDLEFYGNPTAAAPAH